MIDQLSNLLTNHLHAMQNNLDGWLVLVMVYYALFVSASLRDNMRARQGNASPDPTFNFLRGFGFLFGAAYFFARADPIMPIVFFAQSGVEFNTYRHKKKIRSQM